MDTATLSKNLSVPLRRKLINSIPSLIFGFALFCVLSFTPYGVIFNFSVFLFVLLEILSLWLLWSHFHIYQYDGKIFTQKKLFFPVKIYEIDDLQGWKIGVSDVSSTVTLYFANSRKVNFILSGDLVAMFQAIISNSMEMLKKEAKKNLFTHGISFSHFFKHYFVNNKYIEIKNKVQKRIAWNDFDFVTFSNSGINQFITLTKGKQTITLSTYLLRKNIGAFYFLLDLIRGYNIKINEIAN